MTVVLGLLCVHALASKDYYDLLSVPRGASDSQIKRSYRKLALQYHPDKAQGSTAEKEKAAKKFAEISNAYEALVDPEKRQIYDRHGEEGLKQHDAQGSGGGPQDIFSHIFGQGGPFGGFGGFGDRGFGEEEEQTPKGNNVYVELEVTLKDLFLGNTFTVTRDKNVIKPAKGKRQCNCKNKMVTKQLGPGMFQQFQTQECEQCSNVKFARESETLQVTVEPGMKDNEEINFFEEGEPMIDGEPGDLKFVLRTRPDKRFLRQGNDLLYNATITLVDALLGFSVKVKHLDGHDVTLAASDITIPGRMQTLKGEGMPLLDQAGKRGDMHVTYTVRFPEQLNESQKKCIKELNNVFPVRDDL